MRTTSNQSLTPTPPLPQRERGLGGEVSPKGEVITHLHLHIGLRVTAPFIAGPILLHLIDGPMTRRAFEASLTNLKYYCEIAATD